MTLFFGDINFVGGREVVSTSWIDTKSFIPNTVSLVGSRCTCVTNNSFKLHYQKTLIMIDRCSFLLPPMVQCIVIIILMIR